MSSIQVTQEFVVETDITVTVNNTGKHIMGETSENTVLLSDHKQQEVYDPC